MRHSECRRGCVVTLTISRPDRPDRGRCWYARSPSQSAVCAIASWLVCRTRRAAHTANSKLQARASVSEQTKWRDGRSSNALCLWRCRAEHAKAAETYNTVSGRLAPVFGAGHGIEGRSSRGGTASARGA